MSDPDALLCDASYNETTGIAGIAVCEGAGHRRSFIRIADVVEAGGSTDAELLAIMRACAIHAAEQRRCGQVFTDSEAAWRIANRDPARLVGYPLGEDVAAMIRRHQVHLRVVNRGAVQAAHLAAGAVRRAWEAGGAGSPTFTPQRYLKR